MGQVEGGQKQEERETAAVLKAAEKAEKAENRAAAEEKRISRSTGAPPSLPSALPMDFVWCACVCALLLLATMHLCPLRLNPKRETRNSAEMRSAGSRVLRAAHELYVSISTSTSTSTCNYNSKPNLYLVLGAEREMDTERKEEREVKAATADADEVSKYRKETR